MNTLAVHSSSSSFATPFVSFLLFFFRHSSVIALTRIAAAAAAYTLKRFSSLLPNSLLGIWEFISSSSFGWCPLFSLQIR
jgi:Na+/alanine symporter